MVHETNQDFQESFSTTSPPPHKDLFLINYSFGGHEDELSYSSISLIFVLGLSCVC